MHDTTKQRESFWESYEKMQLCFALEGTLRGAGN